MEKAETSAFANECLRKQVHGRNSGSNETRSGKLAPPHQLTKPLVNSVPKKFFYASMLLLNSSKMIKKNSYET